jgi:MYXO-CTERM domain-containing protein
MVSITSEEFLMNLSRNASVLALSAACAMPVLAQSGGTPGQTDQAGQNAQTSTPNTQASPPEKRDNDRDLGWLGLLGLAGLLGLRRRDDNRADYRDNRSASTTP